MCYHSTFTQKAGAASCTDLDIPIANCSFSKAVGCIGCDLGFYLSKNHDPSKNACTKIPDTLLHCTSAMQNLPADPAVCVRCSPAYYLDANSTCQKVTGNVDNCEVYKNANDCEFCVDGFSFDTQAKTCTESVENKGGCAQYTGDHCDLCAVRSGYFSADSDVVTGQSCKKSGGSGTSSSTTGTTTSGSSSATGTGSTGSKTSSKFRAVFAVFGVLASLWVFAF